MMIYGKLNADGSDLDFVADLSARETQEKSPE